MWSLLTLSFIVGFLRLIYCDNLVSVVVIFRHGDRTPIDPYPTDPYRNQSLWPVDFGQLTNLGKERHLELGKWFRKRYTNFLPEKYNETDLYVRSTDVDRTLMSAEVHLAGLYPPVDNQIWNKLLLWQPIPIHTLPEKMDAILAMKKPCPKYHKLYNNLLNNAYFKDIYKKNEDLFNYLTKNTGTKIDNLEKLEYIYSTLFIEKDNNFKLPKWTDSIYPKRLEPLAALSFSTACYTKDLARLKTGLLFNEIIEHFHNATIKGSKYYKYKIYSGHDTTIANVLNSIDAFQLHCPPYTSTLIFELYKRNNTNGDHYINIYYKNATNNLINIIPSNCSNFNCDFNEFVNILKPITLDFEQWNNECQLGWITNISEFNSVGFIVFGGSFILLLFIAIFIFIITKNWKKIDTTYTQLPNDESV